MTKINIRRVILGGILGGLVIDLLGFFVDGILLGPRWAAEMRALGHPAVSSYEILWMDMLGIIGCVIAVWIYAAIRPRLGAGIMTAVNAGLVVWVVGSLLPNASFMYLSGLFSHQLAVYTTLGALVETVVGTIIGAAFYKEPKAPAPAPAPAPKTEVEQPTSA